MQATRLEKGEGKGDDDTMASGCNRSKEGREKRSVSKKGFDRELVYNLANLKQEKQSRGTGRRVRIEKAKRGTLFRKRSGLKNGGHPSCI